MKNYLQILFVLAISIFSIIPFFNDGFFLVHDDTQVARVSQMAKSLYHGMIPVRWVMDLGYGYGYPIFNFYGPFAYYLGGFINIIGIDAVNSTKIMMIIGTLIAGVGMYLFARDFWGKYGGVVSAVLYIFAPYHAVNIYVRGAVGELFAYGLLPFVLWGIFRINSTREFRYVVASAIFIALLITSHNLTAMMFSPVLFTIITYFLIKSILHKNYRMTLFLGTTAVSGLLLSAFYWLPALLQLKYTNVFSQVGGGAYFGDHYICISQLWESNWGFGGSTPTCFDGMSYRIGKLHVIAAFFSLTLLFFRGYRREKLIIFLVFSFIILSVFITTSYSEFIWKHISVMPIIQYPWRFLSFIALSTSFLGGTIVWLAINKYLAKKSVLRFVLVFLISIVVAITYKKLFVAQDILQRDDAYYTNQKALMFNTSRISDEYLPKGFLKPDNYNAIPKERFYIISGNADVSNVFERTTKYAAVIDVKSQSVIQVRLAYFPAWKLIVNGNERDYRIVDGKITFLLPVNVHEVILLYISTPIEKLGNILSIIGFILILIGIIVARLKKAL